MYRSEMKILTSNVTRILIASCLLGLLVGEYFSQLMYLSFKAGIVEQVSINSAQIKMDKGWFPLFSDKSWIGQRFVKQQGGSGAFFIKTNGWRPGIETSMIVSSVSLPLMTVSREQEMFVEKEYRWGRVKILKESYAKQLLVDTDYKWVALFKNGGMVFYLKDISTLNEIVEIEATP